ncbi:MAG: NUDIX domain-containing protein [Candidatus Adlerbacteria bacterium]|nr:NUDIX domain-containing protein [Candidatus Adlerbacteria bacterium]
MRESAGGIVVGPDGRIVLVFQHGNSWSFPKGGVEEGETSAQAATREIYEEAGITQLEFVEELGSYERSSIGKDGIGEHIEWGLQKKTLFLCTTKQHALQPHDSEVTEARYVTLDEATEMLTHPKDREFLTSVRGRIDAWMHSR